jgi:hypothetical protein
VPHERTFRDAGFTAPILQRHSAHPCRWGPRPGNPAVARARRRCRFQLVVWPLPSTCTPPDVSGVPRAGSSGSRRNSLRAQLHVGESPDSEPVAQRSIVADYASSMRRLPGTSTHRKPSTSIRSELIRSLCDHTTYLSSGETDRVLGPGLSSAAMVLTLPVRGSRNWIALGFGWK